MIWRSGLFFLCFLLAFPSLVDGQSDASQSKKIEAIRQQIQSNKAEIKKKKASEKKILSQLGVLKRDLRIESRRLRNTERQLQSVERNAQLTRSELKDLEKKYKEKSAFLAQRLRSVYKNKNLGFLEFVFSPKNYADAMSHSYFFERMMTSDIALIEEILAEQKALTAKEDKLAAQMSNVSKLKADIQGKKTALSSKSRRYNRHLAGLRKDIAHFEERNRILTEASKEIGVIIETQPKGKKSSRKFYGSGTFIKPARGWISSRYGYRRHPIFKRRILHSGVDIAAPRGYEIRAATNGYILFSGWQKGYGNVTIIDHGWKDGKRMSTVYAHQHRMVVRKGQWVNQGQLIGYVGSTGYSTGPHLHFELRLNGKPTNPFKFMRW